jgi:regulator of protease activity HflC (stomatin/prohibitin superfamily)
LIVFILFIFFFKFFIIVEPGERAIIFNRATGTLVVREREGFYPLIPILHKPTIYDVRIRTYTMSAAPLEGEVKGDDSLQALTSDGQNVYLDLTVRSHPNPERLDQLHRRIGPDYVNRVVRPQVRSIVRMVVAGFSVTEVYSEKRRQIEQLISSDLGRTFADNYLVLDELLLRNVQFSEEFQKAIENKQIAQQEAQRMKYVLEKQELEKQQRIIEAQGEAESIRLKGKALQENPMLVQYEYVKLLAPNVQAIVTDQNSIFNFADFLKSQKK